MEGSDSDLFLVSDHIQRHHSLPETSSDSRLRSRGNVSSTPKRAGNGSRCRVTNTDCHTDPVPRKRPRTSFYEDHGPNPVTPARHLPTPIRPRASSSEIATWFAGESKHISLISGHPWINGPTSGEHAAGLVHSLAYSSGPICRICHEGDQAGPLSSYCACTGTMGMLHSCCLERWLATSNAVSCELCHERFPTTRVLRTLTEWYREAPDHRRALVADVICFVMLSPIAGMGLELCIQGATRQTTTKQIIQAGSLILLSLLLITAFLVWSYFTVRYHYRCFRKWREDNATVILVPRDDVMIDLEGSPPRS
ncbi:E3 ubiquitin-protein ligase MARCHF3 isoform X2 [Rhipicephalus microplus]|uniref:E3 ubiquitin-protein ligase MARCHF3 isoform X2 n=1 Tax=Rhipicephalus microplus TaxID=6941 RepID=UPI003F6ACCB9